MRLTTGKAVVDMDMVELAHNSCYAKDGKARYRDYDMDMDARDFARNLMSTLTKDELPLKEVSFDEEILENLQYDCFSDIRGLIALFYRNLWAMANLRETLKKYEDLEEQCILENQCGIRELLMKWKEFFDDIGELYDYRKAEEQGLLLRLPCKVGDTVYRYCEYNGNVMEYEILNIHISSYASGGYDIAIEGVTEDDEGEEYEFCLSVTEFKKECFASHEEAESALAEKGE